MEKPIQVRYSMKKMLSDSSNFRSWYCLFLALADADDTTLEFTRICMDALAIHVCQRYFYWTLIFFFIPKYLDKIIDIWIETKFIGI